MNTTLYTATKITAVFLWLVNVFTLLACLLLQRWFTKSPPWHTVKEISKSGWGTIKAAWRRFFAVPNLDGLSSPSPSLFSSAVLCYFCFPFSSPPWWCGVSSASPSPLYPKAVWCQFLLLLLTFPPHPQGAGIGPSQHTLVTNTANFK